VHSNLNYAIAHPSNHVEKMKKCGVSGYHLFHKPSKTPSHVEKERHVQFVKW
jgi:hypothetical protein